MRPFIETIVQAVTASLVEILPDLQVTRNGSNQITLFNRLNYNYAQVVVGDGKVYLVTKFGAESGSEDGIRTMDMADPNMLDQFLEAVGAWYDLKQ